MKPLHKDLFLLFLYTVSNTVYYIWSLIYPYQASYLKHLNPLIKMKDIFSATIAMFFGITVGNLILPKFYYFFGIKKTMQIGGVFYLLNCIGYFFFISKFFVILNIMFTGTIYQFYIMSVTFYLSEKYENGHLYCNYVFVGQNIANVLWPFMAVILINPENVGMEMEILERGEITNYFPWSISQNFPFLMSSIGFVSFFFTMIPTFFLEDPNHIKPVFFEYVKAFFSGDKNTLNELSNSFKKSNFKNSIYSLNSSQNIILEKKIVLKNNLSNEKEMENLKTNSKNKKLKENLLIKEKKEMTYSEAEEKSKKIMKSPLFILFILILTLRQSPLAYILDNYKLIAFKVIKNDKTICLALSISSFFGILGQVSISYIWKKLDFYKTHLFLNFSVLFGLFIYLLFSVHQSFYMFLIIVFFRVVLQMVYGSNYLTKFDLFKPKVAVCISKSIDNNYLFSVILMIILNYMFFIGDDISTIFFIFLLMNIGATILLIYYFKDFKEYMKNI